MPSWQVSHSRQWNGHGHHGRDAVPRRVFPPKNHWLSNFSLFFSFPRFSLISPHLPRFEDFPRFPPGFQCFSPYHARRGQRISPGLSRAGWHQLSLSKGRREHQGVPHLSGEARGAQGAQVGWGDRDRPMGDEFSLTMEKSRMKTWGVQPWRMMGVE